MMKWKRMLGALMAAGLLVSAMPMEALAGTKYVTSISLKVHAELEAGDSVGDNDDIAYEKQDSGTYVYTTASRYHVVGAEWANDKDISIGDEPKMYVWLEIDDDDNENEYKFRSSYSSSNVSVSGGSYVTSSKSGSDLKVTIRVNPIKGTYDPPENAEWGSSRGRATWDAGDSSSGYYDVYLYRGSSTVKKVEDYKGTSYNFYPYMTKEGDYTFKVRTVPHSDGSYGKKSDWTESDDLYIDEDHVSDGTGQSRDDGVTSTGGTTDVGWRKDNDKWYFKYPDGTLAKNGWMKWNDKWYLFDSVGKMLSGWQQNGGNWYYLGESGDMKTGWVKSGNLWYYCNPNQGGPEGAMVKSCWLTINGKTYFMNESGAMVEGWYKVGEDFYYFQPGEGHKLVNTTVNGFVLDANGVWRH